MSKHIPGPWTYIGPYARGWLEDGYAIATNHESPSHDDHALHGPNQGFTEANARLIAAAPELLAACEAAQEDAQDEDGYCYACERQALFDGHREDCWLVKIQAARAKARGEDA